ncbi:MAG: hypothetical protein WCI73_04855, partial [Phycisphaerae bacterium]
MVTIPTGPTATSAAAPRNVNDGSTQPPQLVFYGNDWGLSELPKLPRTPDEKPWTYEATLERLVAAGFGGMQTSPENAALVRRYGLRLATFGRVNTVPEVLPHFQQVAAAGTDCTALHVGW